MRATTAGSIAAFGGIDRFRSKRILSNWFRWKGGKEMKKIKFLNTELSVAPLCLGTVNYGSAMPEKEAIHQLSRYVELGGNFIDTAHIYGDWEPGMGPLSETAIGKWLKEFPERDRLVIST